MKAKSFAELYRQYGQALLPGVTTTAEAAAIYGEFYTPQDEAQYGVVGLILS